MTNNKTTPKAEEHQEIAEDNGYSMENALKFGWASVSGNLFPERVELLKKYVVGKTILDAGCGGGGYVDFLSRTGLDVTGVDKFGEFLSVAKNEVYQGKFYQADILDLPFADKTFDTTFCFDVMEHVDDVKALRELARVTRKRILIAVPASASELLLSHGLTTFPYCDQTHLRYYTEKSLLELSKIISPNDVDVFPSNPIDFGRLVDSMLVKENVGVFASRIGKSEPNWRKRELKRIILSSITRIPIVQKMFRPLYTTNLSYKTIYSDLVCVIDLD